MPGIRLIHWHAAEGEERATRLREAGFEVRFAELDGAGNVRAVREDPPEAVVIDLSRLPSHGREVARALRSQKATRRIPLVLAGGAPEKVARAREELPDAVYTSWDEIEGALAGALAAPPADPVVPAARSDGYSGTPLPKKLGIKPGSVVLLAGAPAGFEATLGDLPAGAVLCRETGERCDLLLWFTRTRAELEAGAAEKAALGGAGGLWILWPKRASGVPTDVSESLVRQAGIAAGLVDYKIAAIDATWSGLRFARRR